MHHETKANTPEMNRKIEVLSRKKKRQLKGNQMKILE